MSKANEEFKSQPLKSYQNKGILSYKNKNDTFYLLIKTIHSIDQFFIFIYSFIKFNLNKISNKKIFNIKNLIFKTFLFSFFTLVLNENINISTDLLINAYFNDSPITHISYDKIIKKKNEENNNIHNSNNNYYYNNNDKICQNSYDYQDCLRNSECCHIKDNNSNQNKIKGQNDDNFEEKDYYILNIFPIKCIIITCFSFFSLYIIIKTTYYSKINNSIFLNMVGVYTSFKILSYLYIIKYYLASAIIFILFFYFFKCSIDSIYLILKFKRSEFEIFSTRLSAINSRQFILKFIILFTGSFLSGFLSIYYFQYYFNYIAFYICLFTFVIFLSNCIENEFLSERKYSKNVLIFIFGLINFTANKILKKKILYK